MTRIVSGRCGRSLLEASGLSLPLQDTTRRQRVVPVSCTTAGATLNNPRSSIAVASVWPQIESCRED